MVKRGSGLIQASGITGIHCSLHIVNPIVLTGLVGATVTGAPVEGSLVTGFSVGDGVASDEGDFVGDLVGCGKTRQWIESGIRHHTKVCMSTEYESAKSMHAQWNKFQ